MSVEADLLLLEVPPVFFVHQHQVQVILDAEPVAHVLVRRRQVVRRQEQSHRYALPPHGRPVHHFVFRNRLRLVVRVGPDAGALSSSNLNLHVLDLDPDQQEKDLTHDDVFKVVLRLGVLELYVQAVLYADFHLDPGVVEPRRRLRVSNQESKLLAHRVAVRALHRDPHGVAQAHVDALVRLVRELDVFELERDRRRRREFSRRHDFSDQGHKVERVSAVKVEFDLPEHLDLHAEVVHAFAR